MISGPERDQIRNQVLATGAYAAGFARAEGVDARACDVYADFIAQGRHGDMAYLERYDTVRSDPRLLLGEAKTLIVTLFAYPNNPQRALGAVRIADYALGDDYHYVLRQQLQPVYDWLADKYGAMSRICVDTAPLRERYWAQKAGLGFIGRNNQLTVPGVGANFFIATIVTTVEIAPDAPFDGDFCGTCRRCVDACPTHALDDHGGCDATRCLSYLTIESRNPQPQPVNVYGCDICRLACPHNHKSRTTVLAQFTPRPELLSMTPQCWQTMPRGDWRRLTRNSPLRRQRR